MNTNTYINSGFSFTDVYFKIEPEPYYYNYPGRITVIQCVAVKVTSEGDEIPIDAVLYRNSERFNTVPSFSPDRHQAHIKDRAVAGIVIRSTEYEDAGSRYYCEVESNGGEVVRSRVTKILVGGEIASDTAYT